ncbi:MAG: hypothetical protein SFX72_03745 [Isosphaeraceae bacterium]|nr:hypothetical protein [Isosphaeraceae bacterium]
MSIESVASMPSRWFPRLRAVLGRLPLGFLGTLVLIALVESALGGMRLEIAPPPTLSWIASDDATRSGLGPIDVLCLGDSLIKHGLLPLEIERLIGKPSFNLAVSAAQPPTTEAMLRHALDRGARPSAIVIGYSPDMLLGGPSASVRNYPEILGPLELIDLAREARDRDFGTEAIIGSLLPSVRARFELRAMIASTVLDPKRERDREVTASMLLRNWSLNRGAQFTPERPEYRGEVSEADIERLSARRFWCNRLNMKAIERTIRLATDRGIRVYWLLCPVTPALREVRVASGSESKETAFVEGFLGRFPGLTVIDARESGLPSDCFVDPIHTSGRGALRLTKAAAAILADPTRTGLVRVSAPEVDWGDPPYETLHESEFAVRSAAGRLRR